MICAVDNLFVGMIVGGRVDREVLFGHFRRIERGRENKISGSTGGM